MEVDSFGDGVEKQGLNWSHFCQDYLHELELHDHRSAYYDASSSLGLNNMITCAFCKLEVIRLAYENKQEIAAQAKIDCMTNKIGRHDLWYDHDKQNLILVVPSKMTRNLTQKGSSPFQWRKLGLCRLLYFYAKCMAEDP